MLWSPLQPVAVKGQLLPLLLQMRLHSSGRVVLTTISSTIHFSRCLHPGQLRPQHLDFLWAPHKLIFRFVFQVGELDEVPPLILVKDSEQEVVEDTLFDIWKPVMDQSLLQEEVDQRRLVVAISQSSQALQDAGDAQVVVSATANDITYFF